MSSNSADYMRKWRKSRIARGLCSGCGLGNNNGRKYCVACLDYFARRRQLLKESGLCTHCGKDVANPGNITCESCRGLWRARQQISRASGVCPACNHESAGLEKTLCESCLSKADARRQAFRSSGICTTCGKNIAKVGKTKCESCLVEWGERYRVIREEALEAYGGICEVCGESNRRLLELDHKNGDGASHRKEVGRGVFRDLKKRGWPPIMRVLCGNHHNEASYPNISKTQLEIIAAYGGKCVHCGNFNPRHLEVDHINDDGKQRRKAAGGQSQEIRSLKKLGWPQGIVQLLCANCHNAKTYSVLT